MGKKQIAVAITVVLAAAYSLVAVPTASAAPRREVRNNQILIGKDKEFTKKNGVRSGAGTMADPYVISNWDTNSIEIHDTDSHFIIENNKVQNLILNWNGNNVTVINNEIGDLRVNENVPRTGAPTTGEITHNTFGVVGQLRHFDGVFAYNTVGAPSTDPRVPFFTDDRAVNFDGFNGSHFHDNTLYGYLEVRLHGHHHSSGYGETSHDHSAAHQHAEHSMDDMVDHTDRYHEVWVYDNTIYASGPYALTYTDTNHAGNDRTANSEDNEALNQPHTHHTRIHLTGNKLIGSGLYVDVFNADDENHIKTSPGLMEIRNNDITVSYGDDRLPFETHDGINVWLAKDLKLQIVGNTIRYDGSADPVSVDNEYESASGIGLNSLDKANVSIFDNTVENFFYGVSASDMSKTVFWTISGLVTNGVSQKVFYDQSVKNKPEMDH